MERIYEDNELVAFFRQGGSDYLLVTFSDALDVATGDRFFADTPVAKADLTCIGIVGRTPNWYPVAAMRKLAEAVRPHLNRSTTRIGYGGSMGGYGAIKHSRLLGLTHAIALCPQWSIDRAECDGRDPGFQYLYRPEMAGHHVRPEEVAGRIFLLFDPEDPIDGFQAARLLAASPSARAVPTRNLGHHVAGAFAGTAKLTALIAAVRSGDLALLGSLTAQMRRATPERAHIVLSKAVRSHPRQAARALRHPTAGYRNRAGHPTDLELRLLDRLLADKAAPEARSVLTAIAERNPEAQAAAELLLFRHGVECGPPQHRLVTTHATMVVYDLLAGGLRHVAPDEASARKDRLLPALLRMKDDHAGFRIVLNDRWFRLDVMADGRCRPVPALGGGIDIGAGRLGWTVEPDPRHPAMESRRAFRQHSGYLCADIDAQVSANRSTINEWETFELVPSPISSDPA